jgi:hypothetical protein
MIKKDAVKLVAIVAATVLASSTWAGTLIFQGYYGTEAYKPANGGVVDPVDNWTIALYKDSSGNGIGAFGDADDVLLGTSSGYGALGVTLNAGNPWNAAVPGLYLEQANDVPDALHLFARIYNSSTFVSETSRGSATMYVNIGQWAGLSGIFNNGVWTETFPASGQDSVTLPGTNPDGSDWRPVPEPASLALFGLGIATLAARKLRRK